MVATGASSEEPAHAQARPVGHLLDEGLVVVVPDCGQELVSFVLALPVGDYGVLGGDEVLEVPPIRAHGILAQLDLIAWLHLHLSHHVGESRPRQDLAHREGQLQHLWASQRELERTLLTSSRPTVTRASIVTVSPSRRLHSIFSMSWRNRTFHVLGGKELILLKLRLLNVLLEYNKVYHGILEFENL